MNVTAGVVDDLSEQNLSFSNSDSGRVKGHVHFHGSVLFPRSGTDVNGFNSSPIRSAGPRDSNPDPFKSNVVQSPLSDSSLEAHIFEGQSCFDAPYFSQGMPSSVLASNPYALSRNAIPSSPVAPAVAAHFSPPPLGPSGPLFLDPFGAGPSNWIGSSSASQREIQPLLIPSPSPSLASSFPTHTSSEFGYMADSSSDGFVFPMDSPIPIGENEANLVNSPSIIQTDDLVPMECSPPISIHSSSAGNQAQSVSSKVRGKKPLTLKLSKKGDKFWNWVKDACPSKRRSTSRDVPVPGSQALDAGSICLSFLKPFKKRKCTTGSSVSDDFSNASEGGVTPRTESPRDP
ncbi:uncharacterized protein LOC110696872 [Chenopodium quinoa]|uniref:uncharacterized protein LOC110696872 n=1 Tax=Chenopodium quinoa TaxID=63459 RepID=UPI000B7996A7|nr:uncharacterized protein LOC110696872 [Chenopodium quinoa]